MGRKKQIRQSLLRKFHITYEKVRWNSSVRLPETTIVGRYCSIAHNVHIIEVDHPLDRFTSSLVTYQNNYWEFKFSQPFNNLKKQCVLVMTYG